ncbi:trna ligase [Coemansia sp. RSA 2618]|nr:trna ligase [Coemansia sp. RSA 2618]
MSGGTRVLLMPVASIGCGKTTVALALSRLFGFGHIQNDNINVKKNARGIFHKKILEEFENHNFVIADRNNHMPVLRQSLVEAMHADLVNCRVIALYWDHENAAPADILKHTMGRVISRGEAHQSLTPKRTSDFRGVMKGFVNKLVPLNLESESDNAIEDIIELDPLADSSVNLRTVIDALCKMFPDELKRPSEEDIDKALERALVYKPTVQKNVGSPNNKKEQKPLFFGLVPSQLKVDKWIEKTVGANSGAEWDVCRSMLSTGGHDRTYHITLAHMFSTNTLVAKNIYGGYMELFKKPELVDSTVVDCTADYIVCNDKVMALRVKSLAVDNSSKQLPGSIVKQAESSGKASVATVNLVPHITLAVAKGAKAAHSNEMMVQVFGSKNADVPVSLPDGWAVIPVALEFKAAYEKFTS